jgi:hypothetical protein
MSELDIEWIIRKITIVTPLWGRGLSAFHGKRDTLECDIIIGGLISFSPIVIYVVWLDKSSSPKDYFSHANTICIFALRLRDDWQKYEWPIRRVRDLFESFHDQGAHFTRDIIVDFWIIY